MTAVVAAGLAALVASRPDVLTGLNPKGLLLFLALLPQFVGGSWPVAVQIAALGLLHVVVCGVVYSWSSGCTDLRRRPGRRRLG